MSIGKRGPQTYRGGRMRRDMLILHRQEALAIRLLDRALSKPPAEGQVELKDEVAIDIQLDVFDKVARWIAVQNRLTEIEETQIDDFKRRIHGDYKGEAHQKRAYEPDDGGSTLRRLKARLPSANVGGHDGHSGDPGGEDTALT